MKFLCAILIFFCFSTCVAQPAGKNNPGEDIQSQAGTTFTFKLDYPALTSIGIYNWDGDLVSIMMTGGQLPAGQHTYTWNGKDNNGNLLPNGNYHVQVTSDTIKARWVGGIGNNSDSLTGPAVWRGANPASITFINDSTGYVLLYKSEASYNTYKFNVRHPRQKINVLHKTDYTSNFQVCSDNKYVYTAAQVPDYSNNSRYVWGVYAFAINNDSNSIQLPNTVAIRNSGNNYYMLDTVQAVYHEAPVNVVTSVAVQKNGDYLFVGKVKTIDVINKRNWNTVRRASVDSSVRKLVCDKNGHLFSANQSGTVVQYNIGSDGSLTQTAITTDNRHPLYIDIAPDGSNVATLDASTQQVKRYSTTNLVKLDTFGVRNGYYNSPAVANNKLYFKDDRGTYTWSFVVYQPNGTLEVGDGGNNRIMHYTRSFTYMDQITWQPQVYFGTVETNNPTNVWLAYMKFRVDYSNPDNLKWQYVANYGARRQPSLLGEFYDFAKPQQYIKFPNGRTYCDLHVAPYSVFLAEVTDTGFRKTSFKLPFSNLNGFDHAGNYIYTPTYVQGRPLTALIYFNNGTDANGDPIYSFANTLFHIPWTAQTNNTPRSISNVYSYFSDSSMALYDFSNSNSFHNAVLKKGSTHFNILTQPSLPAYQVSIFPTNGNYPLNAWYTGSFNRTSGDVSYNAYHGEGFAGQAQENIWNLFYKNGLFLAQFGAATSGDEAGYGQAGNVLQGDVFALNADEDMVGHVDESKGGKYHFWHVTGKKSIRNQVIDIAKNGTPNVVLPYTDLLAGLVYGDTVHNNINGRTVSAQDTGFHTFVGHATTSPDDPDVEFNFIGLTYPETDRFKKMSFVLPGNGHNWELTGNIYLPTGFSNGFFNPSNLLKFTVYDAANKAIGTFQKTGAYGTTTPQGMKLNDRAIAATTYEKDYTYQKGFFPFTLSASGGRVYLNFMGNTVSAPVYQAGADILHPAKFAIEFTGGSEFGGTGILLNVKTLRFNNK